MEIGSKNTIQGPSTRAQGCREYMRLQNAVEDECGVQCTILVKPGECISVKTQDWADFYLARSVINPRTILPIVRQGFEEKPKQLPESLPIQKKRWIKRKKMVLEEPEA